MKYWKNSTGSNYEREMKVARWSCDIAWKSNRGEKEKGEEEIEVELQKKSGKGAGLCLTGYKSGKGAYVSDLVRFQPTNFPLIFLNPNFSVESLYRMEIKIIHPSSIRAEKVS